MKSYPMSYVGLENAINDRKHHLKVRKRVFIVVGLIVSITVLNLPSASIIAFKCI